MPALKSLRPDHPWRALTAAGDQLGKRVTGGPEERADGLSDLQS